MIALLIGGTVVLCIGLLTVVFGIPIKEFSFGNTMILAGAVVACTGVVLIGLYFVGREFRNLARRLEAGVPVPASAPVALPREVAAAVPPRPQTIQPAPPAHDDRLFTRDQPQDHDEFADDVLHDSRVHTPPGAPASAWQDHPVARSRTPAPLEDSFEPQAEPAERPRRNIMFSSHRRDANRDAPPREPLQSGADDGAHRSSTDDYRHREPESADPFDHAWPQPGRTRPESPSVRNGRSASSAAADQDLEPVRERFQPPRRADAPSVTIVKSGVVDSMAYSLYSDGSIEAQMPEGMVRFASIDELRAHLDERN
ncbi:hypothetical protein BH10PSE10_BH10PSE10_10000 [soil metagenome]